MYCSIAAPLGLIGSLEGSCRPSSPNQDPQRTGNTVPFLVMRPAEFTRNTAPEAPMVNGTAAVAVLNVGVPLSNAVAVAVWLPAARPVALKLYGERRIARHQRAIDTELDADDRAARIAGRRRQCHC